MPWTLTADPEAYAARVSDLLAGDPARHTIALTVLAMARKGHRWADEPGCFGWYEDGDGAVRGAVFHAPPFELGLGLLPEAATAELARELHAAGRAIPGVTGDAASAERFAEAWVAEAGAAARVEFRLCLHELGCLTPPDPAPSGRARPAHQDDVDLLAEWYGAFAAETNTRAGGDATAMVRERLEDGRLWVWEDRGDERVVLFTDLANPTTNAIYRGIGFRPVTEHRVVAFGG